jgi:hypothetical protein
MQMGVNHSRQHYAPLAILLEIDVGRSRIGSVKDFANAAIIIDNQRGKAVNCAAFINGYALNILDQSISKGWGGCDKCTYDGHPFGVLDDHF